MYFPTLACFPSRIAAVPGQAKPRSSTALDTLHRRRKGLQLHRGDRPNTRDIHGSNRFVVLAHAGARMRFLLFDPLVQSRHPLHQNPASARLSSGSIALGAFIANLLTSLTQEFSTQKKPQPRKAAAINRQVPITIIRELQRTRGRLLRRIRRYQRPRIPPPRRRGFP